MLLSRGIAVDTWVMVSRECDISCDVVDDQAQFVLGHDAGSLTLVVNKGALAKLADVVATVNTRWQAVPAGERLDFSMPRPSDTDDHVM